MDSIHQQCEEAREEKSATKTLSIVIVTWNCMKFTEECLDSLRSYMHNPMAEIIVVDNASSDGTSELVRDCYPEVTFIQTGKNLGFAKGNNVGILRSTGEYIFLINPDVQVLNGCIEGMLAYMEKNPKIGLLGPRMLGTDRKPYRSYMGAPTLWRFFCRALFLDTLFSKSKLMAGYLMPYFDGDQIAEVDILNGWFWMTRREALNEVGLLDESLFMYGDDLDWCKRFREAGWKIVYFPEVESIHYGGGSSGRARVQFCVEMQRANFQYFRKNFGPASILMFPAIVWIHHAIRLVVNSLLFMGSRSKRSEATRKIKECVACMRWAMGLGYHKKVRPQ
jgi:GT2 family glycosyltransferase